MADKKNIKISNEKLDEKIQENNLVIEEKSKEIKDEDLKKLIEKNIKWSQVIYNQNKKIKHRITLMVVGNYVRLFLIFVPIVIGIIYLPDFIENYLDKYSWILDLENQNNLDVLLKSLK
ncbi:MAG: hypothetical protein WC414_02585 [Patescibacteria group bacterium]